MDVDDLMEAMKQKLSMAPSLNCVMMFDLGDDGIIAVDGTGDQPALSRDAVDEADTTLTVSAETLGKIVRGEQDPNIAFMMGKLKVSGKMGYALKLNGILED